MNGQVKQLIPGLIGIFCLLLTAIVGISTLPSEQQVIQVAGPRAIILERHGRQKLAAAVRTDAEKAAIQTGLDIAADLAVDMRRSPADFAAKSERSVKN